MMRSIVFVAILGFSISASAETPCKAYRDKVPKLNACSTASAFCSSYLGGSASLTKTVYKTTTVPHSFTRVTSTSTESTTIYSATTTVADPNTTSIVTKSTTTTTTIPPSCTTFNNKARRSALPELAAHPQASCGLDKKSKPANISGACNCVLASTITVERTKTRDGTSTATIHKTTTTTSVVTTESTATTIQTSTTTSAAQATATGTYPCTQGSYSTFQGSTFQTHCDTIFLGHTFRQEVTDATDFIDCQQQCVDLNTNTNYPASCVGVSFFHSQCNQNCYLLDAIDPAGYVPTSDFVAARMLSPSSYGNTCIDGTTSFGDTYTAPNGDNFQVLCGMDFYGNNLNNGCFYASSQDDCYDNCSQTNGCDDAVYFNDPNNAAVTCCMKDAHYASDYNDDRQDFQVDNAVFLATVQQP